MKGLQTNFLTELKQFYKEECLLKEEGLHSGKRGPIPTLLPLNSKWANALQFSIIIIF